MKILPCHWRSILPIVPLLLAGHSGICFNSAASLTAEEIVRKAFLRAQAATDDSRRADYAYSKRVIVEELDNQGSVTETKEKLFRFSSGLGSLEQTKINGRLASGAQVKKDEDRIVRQGSQLLDPKTSKRDDNWGKYLTPDLAAKYQFALRERKLINGRPTYVIAFQPKSGALPVRQVVDRLLNQLAGRLWIDEQEFEIARAEIFVQSKVTLGGLMEALGSLKKFSYVLERIRLPDGLWFNRMTSGDIEGRKLLESTHTKTRSETGGFHKIAAEKRD